MLEILLKYTFLEYKNHILPLIAHNTELYHERAMLCCVLKAQMFRIYRQKVCDFCPKQLPNVFVGIASYILDNAYRI